MATISVKTELIRESPPGALKDDRPPREWGSGWEGRVERGNRSAQPQDLPTMLMDRTEHRFLQNQYDQQQLHYNQQQFQNRPPPPQGDPSNMPPSGSYRGDGNGANSALPLDGIMDSLPGSHIKGAGDVEFRTTLSVLGLNFLFFLVLVALYELFSRVIPSVYAGRTLARHPRRGGNASAGPGVAGEGAPIDKYIMPLGWIPPVARTSWTQVRRTGGLDAYMFLRFVRMCFQITAVSGLWGLLVLWPIYATGNNDAHGWYHFSMANLRQGSGWRLWFPTAFMWLLTLYVIRIMSEEYIHYLEQRMEYLTHSRPKTSEESSASMSAAAVHPQQGFTLMVEQIPHELRSDRALFDYFNALFPDNVYSACVVLNVPDLEAASLKRQRITRLLEKNVARHEASGVRPTHIIGGKHRRAVRRVLCCCFGRDRIESSKMLKIVLGGTTPCGSLDAGDADDDEVNDVSDIAPKMGERVDSINYYRQELDRLNVVVDKLQEEKKQLASKGNDSLRATQWIEHALSVASDAAALGFSSGARQVDEDDLILGFGVSRKGRSLSLLFKKIILDFFFSGVSLFNRNLDLVIESVVGSTMSSTGFVTFKDLTSVTCAATAPLCHMPNVLTASIAPDPRDIRWENAHINLTWRGARESTANVFLALGAILWSIPVAVIQALASAEKLSHVPGWGWISAPENRQTAAILNGYLPVLALLGLIMLLPNIFRWIAEKYENRKTETDIERSVIGRFFYYQLTNVFVTVTAGSVWQSLSDILHHPRSVFEILGNSVPTVVGYFITLLFTKVLAGLPLVLLRLSALVRMIFLKTFIREKWLTQREIDAIYKPEMLQYGWEYPTQLLVIVICFTYACISPVILPVGAIYFLGALLVYKKQVLVVYTPTHESGGVLFPSACHRLLVGLICGQVTLIGYTLLREGYYQPLILFPLPILTLSAIRTFERSYAQPALFLSLERAMELDKESTAVVQFSPHTYRQPILAEDRAIPKPYRDTSSSFAGRLGHAHVSSSAPSSRTYGRSGMDDNLGVLHADSGKIV